MLGKILTGVAPLVSPFMDAFVGNKAEDSYERFLKSRGLSKADMRRQLSDASGLEADRAELAKQGVVGNLQSQGLGNSIIGTQAGLQVDLEKNKSLANRASQLSNMQIQQDMANAQDLADFRLGRAGARRQGVADLIGGAFGQGGMLLDWLNKRNNKSGVPR
tara:strand:+ start:30 stop:515 length:486 start_codon:yes stop_codon:yes gene_type:complete